MVFDQKDPFALNVIVYQLAAVIVNVAKNGLTGGNDEEQQQIEQVNERFMPPHGWHSSNRFVFSRVLAIGLSYHLIFQCVKATILIFSFRRYCIDFIFRDISKKSLFFHN